jgi:sugar lactone lactonase YvrE
MGRPDEISRRLSRWLDNAFSRRLVSSFIMKNPALLVALAVLTASDKAHSQTAPVFRGSVELAIGSETDERYTFANVMGIDVDRAGRIVVADLGQKTVSLFDASGKFLFAIGRSGGGPGEYVDGCCVRFSPTGELWIRDMGNTRHVRFMMEPTKAVERGVVRMSAANVGFRGEIAPLADGTIIDVVPRSEPGKVAHGFDLQQLSADNKVLRTVSTRIPPDDSLAIKLIALKQGNSEVLRYFYPPHPPYALFALARDGEFAMAISSRYAVSLHSPDGAIRHVIRRDGTARPTLSAAERERAQRDVSRMREVSGGKAAFDVPARKQPLRGIQFDAAGRLWVERAVPDGAEREADVYEQSGRLVELRRWPANVSFANAYLGSDVAVGVQIDSLGVPKVVRVRFRRVTDR